MGNGNIMSGRIVVILSEAKNLRDASLTQHDKQAFIVSDRTWYNW